MLVSDSRPSDTCLRRDNIVNKPLTMWSSNFDRRQHKHIQRQSSTLWCKQPTKKRMHMRHIPQMQSLVRTWKFAQSPLVRQFVDDSLGAPHVRAYCVRIEDRPPLRADRRAQWAA